MSDVRAELAGVIRQGYRACSGNQMSLLEREQLADAILARFAVTPKPVVTDFKLGAMVSGTSTGLGYLTARECVEMGRKLRHQLTAAGLTIVRIEEPTPTERVG